MNRLEASRALLGVLLLLSAGVGVALVLAAPSHSPSSAPAAQSAVPQAVAAPTDKASAGAIAAKSPPVGAATSGAATTSGYTPPRPLLWKVSDDDNDVYLLGSFHALKPGDYPVGPAVDAAFKDSELVVFEIAPGELNGSDVGQDMMMAAMQTEGGSLQQSIGDDLWRRLQAYADKRGLPVESFQMLEPWFVAMMISVSEMGRAGYDPAQGLDQQLIARAESEHKRTQGLESSASQIAVLDSMSPAEQRQSLSEALDDAEQSQTKMNELHDMWRRGDDAALETLLAGDFKRQYPALYQRLNVDRNQAWVPQVRRMLDDSHADDALVVVGSMHLLGPDGLVSQLKAKGYRVERQ